MMSTSTLKLSKAQIITGVYYLRDVMETASGFKFNADSTFKFFYSYGAIDRNGSGTYTVKDKSVTLNSVQRSEKDFNMVSSKHNSYKGVTIKISDVTYCLIKFISHSK